MTELNTEEDYVHFLDKDTHNVICEALLWKKDILDMRIKEAHDAKAEDDCDKAVNDLLIVNRALTQLCYKGEKE